MSQRGLFATALLVSLTAHAAAAWYWSSHSAAEGAGRQGQLPVPLQVALAPMPPASAPPAQAPAPVVTEATHIEKPRPVKKTKAVPSPQPPATPQTLNETTAPQASQTLAGDGLRALPPAVDYEGLRESWRSRVMARIESFKHYPLAARRQRVEGSLEVDLNIGCDGAVASLNVEGGSSLLRSAAAKSVQRAAPLPAPPPHLSCPHRLQYAMVYRLH
jgi:periplasmic protein TonB